MRPQKHWGERDGEKLARIFAVNSIDAALVAKHLRPLLPRQDRSVFAAISARVGVREDNRLGGWYASRASKAAAIDMLPKNLAIELARRAPEAVCSASIRVRSTPDPRRRGCRACHPLLVPATCVPQHLELICRPAHAEKRQRDMHRGEQDRNVSHFSALSN